jgi:AcrR family transcriptional regulator
VLANQRSRIIEAVAEVGSTAGYSAMTVDDIAVAAGISRRSFYEVCSHKEAAFLMALDDIGQQVFAVVNETRTSGRTEFALRLEAVIAAVLRFLAEHQTYADLCLVQVLAAGPVAADRRSAGLRHFTRLLLTAVDGDLPRRGRPPLIVAEGIVGGFYEILYARVNQGQTANLGLLLPDFLYSTLLPYVGKDEARRHERRLRRRVS